MQCCNASIFASHYHHQHLRLASYDYCWLSCHAYACSCKSARAAPTRMTASCSWKGAVSFVQYGWRHDFFLTLLVAILHLSIPPLPLPLQVSALWPCVRDEEQPPINEVWLFTNPSIDSVKHACFLRRAVSHPVGCLGLHGRRRHRAMARGMDSDDSDDDAEQSLQVLPVCLNAATRDRTECGNPLSQHNACACVGFFPVFPCLFRSHQRLLGNRNWIAHVKLSFLRSRIRSSNLLSKSF